MSLALELRAATPADTEPLRVFAAAQGDAALAALERHWQQPRGRPALTRLALRGGAIVGYALLAHRRLRVGIATIESGAIDALVAPGLPTDEWEMLLGDCLGALFEEGLPLALWSGAAAELADYGFAHYQLAATVESSAPPGPAGKLRPATSDDAEALAALYAASYAPLALAEQRAAPDWRAWLNEHRALVLEDGQGRALGYAAPGPVGWAEAAAADAGAARALLAALGMHSGEALRLALPMDHLVARAALQLGGVATQRTYAPGAHAPLAGVVDLAGLLGQLAPELEQRLARSRYAGWSGRLRLELESERVTLMVDAGRVSVADGTRPADVRVRRVELPALAQLCLGYRAAADLRATGGLTCDDAELALTDMLFPAL